MRSLIISLLLFLAAGLLPGQTGRVVHVVDGDTFYILGEDNTRIKVRMYGIDAPESGQDYCRLSTRFLTELIAGRVVTCKSKGVDQYRRQLAIVYLDSVNINEVMVREGYAWQYKYNRDKKLTRLQAEARAAKRGLWAMPNPIDPWRWRKNKQKKK